MLHDIAKKYCLSEDEALKLIRLTDNDEHLVIVAAHVVAEGVPFEEVYEVMRQGGSPLVAFAKRWKWEYLGKFDLSLREAMSFVDDMNRLSSK